MDSQLSLAIMLYSVSVLVATIIHGSTYGWRQKNILALLVLLANYGSAIMVVNYSLNVLGLLYLLSLVYTSLNYFRLVKAKFVDSWLQNISRRTAFIMFLTQAILLVLIGNFSNFNFSALALALIYLAVSLFLAIYTTYRLFKTSALNRELLPEQDLPTVTVAIAARNEDQDLHSCLDSVLVDSYPKLEILVYDDESQDKTADLIRQYAHDGVRFIKGGQIPADWLAKNFAYQTLLDQASGQIVFFIGTDIRLHNSSIIQGVSLMRQHSCDMLSVMPIRTKNGALASLIQPMRYWWELAVPRIFPKRPPTLSSAWFVDRKKLLAFGGFKSYKKSIIPEEHLAKRFSQLKSYVFARSNSKFFVSTHKNFAEQWETLVRIRYPQVHRKPELVYFRTLFLLFLLVPFIVVIPTVIISPFSVASILIAWICILLLYTHGIVSWYTNHFSALIAPLNFPFIILIDIIGINLSMYRYEFSQVIWKDRVVNNKLTVVAKLPQID